MPNDFVLPNDPELTKAIAECTSSEAIKETVKAYLENRGVIHRDRGDGTVRVTGNQPEQPNNLVPTSGYKMERTLKFDPESGRRALILRGNSKEDLDALEAQIMGYGR